jgi:hypothetical protein
MTTILNYIRMVNHKFRGQYGRIVICADSPKSWRKQVFAYYKAHRKNDRQKLEHIEWPKVFELFDSIKKELAEYTHYPIIEVEGGEGDDCIATLALTYSDPSIIISRDRDFQQLQAHVDVKQYDPVDERMLSVDNPTRYLEEHIIGGDRNDGVPNILSDDDVLVTPGKRQGKMTEQRLQGFLSTPVEEWTNETHKRNWKRNQLMIDLRSVPSTITKAVIEQYEAQKNRKNHRLFDYFVKHKMSSMLDVIDQF